MTWRVLITDGLAAPGRTVLERQAELVSSGLEDAPRDVDALIVRSRTQVTAGTLARCAPRLQVIGRAGVGVDNIDLQAAVDAGVIVVNAPEAASISVAEHTLALMLALARRIPQADASLRRGEWKKGELTGAELHGKTLGLIGLGRIGTLVAERATAFGMQVLAFDPALSEEDIAARGACGTDFETVLEQADVISLHVPLVPGTANLIDAQTLGRMKPGAWLICTSRGGIIDEGALANALQDGTVAGAALDVFEHEPPGVNALTALPNIVLTPHIAGQTEQAQARVAVDIASEVLRALRGEPLRWRVA